jgi:hypothetical protein
VLRKQKSGYNTSLTIGKICNKLKKHKLTGIDVKSDLATVLNFLESGLSNEVEKSPELVLKFFNTNDGIEYTAQVDIYHSTPEALKYLAKLVNFPIEEYGYEIYGFVAQMEYSTTFGWSIANFEAQYSELYSKYTIQIVD